MEISIIGNRYLEGATRYIIEVDTGAGRPRFRVTKRYREFAELHANLKRLEPGLSLPSPLPPKKFFFNTAPGFVAKRQDLLQVYLEGLVCALTSSDRPSWRVLCFFLGANPEALIVAVPQPDGDREAADTMLEPKFQARKDEEADRLEEIVDEMANATINVAHSALDGMGADGEQARVAFGSAQSLGDAIQGLTSIPMSRSTAPFDTTTISTKEEAKMRTIAECLARVAVSGGDTLHEKASGIVVGFSLSAT